MESERELVMRNSEAGIEPVEDEGSPDASAVMQFEIAGRRAGRGAGSGRFFQGVMKEEQIAFLDCGESIGFTGEVAEFDLEYAGLPFLDDGPHLSGKQALIGNPFFQCNRIQNFHFVAHVT